MHARVDAILQTNCTEDHIRLGKLIFWINHGQGHIVGFIVVEIGMKYHYVFHSYHYVFCTVIYESETVANVWFANHIILSLWSWYFTFIGLIFIFRTPINPFWKWNNFFLWKTCFERRDIQVLIYLFAQWYCHMLLAH